MNILILIVAGAAGAMIGIVLAILFVPSSPPRGGRRVQHSTAGPDLAGGVIPPRPRPRGPLCESSGHGPQPTIQEVT